MRLLGTDVEKGTTSALHLDVGELPGGVPVGVEVFVAQGVEDGPVLYLGAGVHGDEVTSTAIVEAVLRAVDPLHLAGTLIAVPVQNPLAFADRHRLPLGVLLRSPMDQGPANVFQSFPGDRGGNLIQRLAAGLFHEVMKHSDYVIDVHTPTTGGRYLPFAFTPTQESGELTTRAREVARRVGARVILSAGGSNYTSAATPHMALAEHGIVGLGLELGQGGLYAPEDIQAGCAGLLNVLAFLDMLEVSEQGIEPAEAPPVYLKAIHKVRADVAGELRVDVRLGDPVEEGQPVGRSLDPLGRVRETFVSPCTGIYMRATTFGFIGTGDLVCQIGEPDTSMKP